MENPPMLLMGKSTISMAIFNSYVKLPEGTFQHLFDARIHFPGGFFLQSK
jgi:DNA-directed RNA polymerase specialized sigma54-like protein